MPNQVLNLINTAHNENKKLFAVLIDPEKCYGSHLISFINEVNNARPDLIFVGGSQLRASIDSAVQSIKQLTNIPVVLFIGNAMQFSPRADAMLFISLISGRNPDLLIGQHVLSARAIKESGIETIGTGYILVDGGNRTAVERVSQTSSLSDTEQIVNTAIAGEMLGQQLLYLEAGSGASNPVSSNIISQVRANVSIPLIVGGGLRSTQAITKALEAGADIVVVGNHLEQNPKDMTKFAETVRNICFGNTQLTK